MGAQRRAHHAAEQAKRDAAEEGRRMMVMLKQQQDAYAKMVETLKPKPVEAPKTLRSTVDDANVGVRTSRSKRKTIQGLGAGAAALRIPLNLGVQTTGSTLNIP